MIIQLKPAIVALALSVSLSGCDSSTQPSTPAVTLKADGVEITLKDVSVSKDVGSMGLVPTAPDGATYVHVSYSLKNVSAKPLSFENWPQPRLVDPAGTKLQPEIVSSTALSAAANASWFENVNPNLSTDAQLVWKVDEKSFDRNSWTLEFQSKPPVSFPLK